MKCFLSSFKLEEESIMRVGLSWRDRVRSQCSNKNQRILERARGEMRGFQSMVFIWMSQIMLFCERQYSCMLLTVQCNVSISIYIVYIYICIYIYIYTSSTFTQSTSGLRLFGSFHKKSRYPNVDGFNSMIWRKFLAKKSKTPKIGFLNIFYLPSNHGLLEEDNSKPASHNTLEKSNLRNNTLHLWPKGFSPLGIDCCSVPQHWSWPVLVPNHSSHGRLPSGLHMFWAILDNQIIMPICQNWRVNYPKILHWKRGILWTWYSLI